MDIRKLLVVDDEPSLRRLLGRYLGRLGYAVEAVGTGAEGNLRFQSGHAGYDLVVLDLSLPDISGEQLLENIREVAPDMPVILCSGALPPPGIDLTGKTSFLHKPFLPGMLKEAIEKALGE